jgi:L-rhamnose isomerase
MTDTTHGASAGSEVVLKGFEIAKERYAAMGVSVDRALERLAQISLSVHCWQGDDVAGFESPGAALGGGLAATGNYPGKARTADELRRDLDLVYSLVPGSHRLNLHAIYAETGGKKVERDQLRPEHFAGWVEWARSNNHGLDFNPTLFSHPMAGSGFTLSSYDEGVRDFWVEHCIACRRVGEYFGRELGTTCVTNIWIPDGMKDTPADRATPRRLLAESLDKILAAKVDSKHNLDSVESKLFGLGSESYVVGSHEFYLGYAISRQILLCLDSGHFHPTETIADKLSSVLMYVPGVVLHISRGVRWDSDHVVTLNDDTRAMMREVIAGDYLDSVHIGLDFFDASINRIAAWVIGARNVLRAALIALLEPAERLREMEKERNYTGRLALMEAAKGMPWQAVWDYYCLKSDMPVGFGITEVIKDYEKQELSRRK